MRLSWCADLNVPTLDPGSCRSGAVEVPISRGSDPRPATDWERDLLRRVVEGEYGAGAYRDLLPNGDSVLLVGRAPYLDASLEVVADAAVLGHLFFDFFDLSWSFKPSEAGVRRLLGRMAEVRPPRLERGADAGEAGPGDPRFAALPGGVGLAERRGGRYVVAKVFRGGAAALALEDAPHDRRALLEVNSGPLEEAASRAAAFVYRSSLRFGRPVVSFSGGKDSSVLLDLVERSGVEHLIYFNDTGLEMPETLEFVESVGPDLVGSAADSFWRHVRGFGPPARDYRWCCKVLKLGPTRRALSGLGRVLSLVGQRRMESRARMRSPPVWRNRWIPEAVVAAPLNDWPALAVWLYAEVRGVRLNPLYSAGFERTGCYLCPASRLADFARVREAHPDLWGEWDSLLRGYAAERGLPDSWVDRGVWRWVRPPRGIARATGLAGPFPRIGVLVRASGGALSVRPDPGPRLRELLRTVPPGSGFRLRGAAALRAAACAGCGLCLDYCDRSALSLSGGVVSVGEGCVSCGVCNRVCPLSLHVRFSLSVTGGPPPPPAPGDRPTSRAR